MSTSTANWATNGKLAAALTATAAAAVVAFEFPVLGVPLALGIAACAALILWKASAPGTRARFSARRRQRAIMSGACVLLAVTTVIGGTFLALDTANTLEHELNNVLKTAHHKGNLTPGQIFQVCSIACARATVVDLPTRNGPGIAKLSGLAMHEQTIYEWRSASREGTTSTAQR